MALAINIDDLLNKQRIESNRIEFKKGWNPVSIYHSVCAFANDFDDLGGGYIVVGVDTDDKTGVAIRPVEGIPIEEIDDILQDMVGYNNKIAPYYMPRTSTEEVDGKTVLVIWCPAGINRPYSVPENVTAKNGSKEYFYIRSGTSSIIAKGEVLDELRELASRVPFDERGNPDIRLEDISTLLLREYLVKVGSKLASEINIRPLQEILEQMDLFVGPKENRMLRNVAAMMFCENPSKFFKRTHVEIVYFPEGRLNNPSNLYEGAVITGSVPQIIDRTLEYLKRMLVMQSIIKPENDYRSRKFYTYPYQALEESVTNSLYHRDYREWEPVVITVEPDSITIQNVGGPDRSISAADISAEAVSARSSSLPSFGGSPPTLVPSASLVASIAGTASAPRPSAVPLSLGGRSFCVMSPTSAAALSSGATVLGVSSSGVIFFLAILVSSWHYIFSGSCEPKKRWVPSS